MKEKLMEIKENGQNTVSGFIAEVGDIGRFDNAKQLQKLAEHAIVANDLGKHNGERQISYRGQKHLRYVLYETDILLVGKTAEFREIHDPYQKGRAEQRRLRKRVLSCSGESCSEVMYILLV